MYTANCNLCGHHKSPHSCKSHIHDRVASRTHTTEVASRTHTKGQVVSIYRSTVHNKLRPFPFSPFSSIARTLFFVSLLSTSVVTHEIDWCDVKLEHVARVWYTSVDPVTVVNQRVKTFQEMLLEKFKSFAPRDGV